ncbi:MAG: hypothetical protein IPN17_24530 [Deltaproteobacteria bacterium]|nr:hypothetical protein [Deltaproteobacteria bacterium]
MAAAVCRALHLDDALRAIELASPMTTKVRIASAEDYSGAALRHVQVCAEQFEHALNSRALAEKVLAYRAPTKPRFLRPGGLTNAEVLHALRAGEATRRAGRHQVIDLHLVLERGGGDGVVGFRRGKRIHTYADYFNSHDVPCMAGHLAHEYAHMAGFGHSREWKPGRKHTVPYALGELVYDVCVEHGAERCSCEVQEQQGWRYGARRLLEMIFG